MIKFIHTADWQIGMKAAHVGAVGEAVRSEKLSAARRVVKAAQKHSVDFMLVAGDTFEDNAVDRVLVQKVADALASFAGPVYLIPGNHDPLVPGSVWDHPAWKSHGHLHVLAEAVPLDVDGAVIYPCPLKEKHSPKDPTRWINPQQASGIAVGLAHGTVQGIAQDELEYPIARDAATRAQLDYLALGHWHSTATYEDADGVCRMAYSGTHESTKFGERDSGNALLVEIEGRGAPPKLTTVRTGGLIWETVPQQILASDDLTKLREQLEAVPMPDKTLLDVRLSGVMQPDGQAELSRIQDIVRARFLYGRIDDAQLLPSPEDESWLSELPVGVLRQVAQRIKTLGDPAAAAERPDYATPEVAARALLELYRLADEAKA